MAQKLIRDIPDEVLAAIEAKAGEDGMNAEAWIRAQLLRLAQQPTVRKQYSFKAYGENGAQVLIRRDRVDNLIRHSAKDCTQAQFDAYNKAVEYVQRNEAGDYEKAYNLLAQHFDEVFPS